MQHHLEQVTDANGFVASCSCGWSSVRAHSDDHANRRWRIHASQQRASELCTEAWLVGSSTRARALELAAVRDAARERRSVLAQQRIELHDALHRAGDILLTEQPTIERTLECARQLSGLSPDELWLRYFAYGGSLSQADLTRTMSGRQSIARRDYEVLSTVLNEQFREQGFGNPLPLSMRR